MSRSTWRAAICGTVLAWVGCSNGGGGDVQLVDVVGTVTYNGAPLSGALVTFVPAKGPLAMGKTDAEGKFSLSTGAEKGAVVGDAKVAVSLAAAGGGVTNAPAMSPGSAKSVEEGKAMMEKMAQQQYQATTGGGADTKASGSLLPEKYSNAETSGLTATVTADAAKNNFPFNLQ